jgi:hypothetical protein
VTIDGDGMEEKVHGKEREQMMKENCQQQWK